jgi:hypothetical protein
MILRQWAACDVSCERFCATLSSTLGEWERAVELRSMSMPFPHVCKALHCFPLVLSAAFLKAVVEEILPNWARQKNNAKGGAQRPLRTAYAVRDLYYLLGTLWYVCVLVTQLESILSLSSLPQLFSAVKSPHFHLIPLRATHDLLIAHLQQLDQSPSLRAPCCWAHPPLQPSAATPSC